MNVNSDQHCYQIQHEILNCVKDKMNWFIDNRVLGNIINRASNFNPEFMKVGKIRMSRKVFNFVSIDYLNVKDDYFLKTL